MSLMSLAIPNPTTPCYAVTCPLTADYHPRPSRRINFKEYPNTRARKHDTLRYPSHFQPPRPLIITRPSANFDSMRTLGPSPP